MKMMAAKVGLSDNRIFAALCVQAERIPEVQILCIAGVFPKVDDQWFLWDLPAELQREVVDATSPKAKLDDLRGLSHSLLKKTRGRRQVGKLSDYRIAFKLEVPHDD
jgi:hypothetical protein